MSSAPSVTSVPNRRAGKCFPSLPLVLLTATAFFSTLIAGSAAQSQTPASATQRVVQAGEVFGVTVVERPPLDDRKAFIGFMAGRCGEDPEMLGWRFDRQDIDQGRRTVSFVPFTRRD